MAVTPDGTLIISLVRDDFHKLGLEGNASSFDYKTNTRYSMSQNNNSLTKNYYCNLIFTNIIRSFFFIVVKIDLMAKHFVPGKKNYERVKTALENHLDLIFDVILIWEPPGKFNAIFNGNDILTFGTYSFINSLYKLFNFKMRRYVHLRLLHGFTNVDIPFHFVAKSFHIKPNIVSTYLLLLMGLLLMTFLNGLEFLVFPENCMYRFFNNIYIISNNNIILFIFSFDFFFLF